MLNRAIALAVVVLLPACMPFIPSRSEPDYRPTYPDVPVPPPAQAGSLYHAGYQLSLFDDRRGIRVGDVVTIQLEERTVASKAAGTKLNKDTTTRLPEPTVLGSVITGSGDNGLLTDITSENEFEGEAESGQRNSLTGTITAIVTQVLPNGLVQIQGEKWLNLNRGEEYVRISGLARPEDIDGDNVVSSLRLADARIAYSGTGELADTNRAGWLTRFFLGPLMPF
jgi:flagellar L-ring protein precursor FlgH